ncbi:zinc-dependent alcohol dehydrogenase [Alteribacter natronophilus]|uniref:zinc-dependent alcohol dehydrogenase n=1 Tax=Alteribacter natronophilus TaxID=2583810 RepID=UPI00110DB975|nr:alcohol dehydrogenase catalytic domain-containing protein [Alteribacter natronophilus]TMW70960.1 zinc-binding dehydrogenase [Alteribacter natronophilus]
MKVLQFDFKLSNYVITKLAGRWMPSVFWHPKLSCLKWQQAPEPELPNDDWVKIKVRYGGICGSDMNLIFLHDSPATSPFASFPFTVGHEAVGVVTETGKNVEHVETGQRVVINPVLSCESRGISPKCEACENGNESLCYSKTKGDVGAGLLIGACRDTGGSWGPYLVSHKTQVIPLPEEVDDLNGVLIEPFSCALHAVLRNPPSPGDHVLVIGSGMIGLSVVAALRALDYDCRITVLAKHKFQGELAEKFGADQVVYLSRGETYVKETAEIFGAEQLKPVIGPSVVQGGAHLVYECVGKKQSVQDSLRFTRSRGTVVLVGLAGIIDSIDWTTVWLNELAVKGCFAYSTNMYKGEEQDTLRIAVDLMKEGRVDLSPLITHQYPLHEYRQAFQTVLSKKSKNVLKVVFDHNKTTTGG